MRPRPFSMPFRTLGILLLAVLGNAFSGCRAPIRTVDVGPERTFGDLNANVLTKGTLSADTRMDLTRFDLDEEFEADPVTAIRKLHDFAIQQRSRPILYSLAELCYLAAEKGGGPDQYLASAVYAYLYLFGSESDVLANPYDRRYRVACDLYNYGLLHAFRSPDGRRFEFRAGSHQLPFGALDVSVPVPSFSWRDQTFDEFIPADNLRVVGFSARQRDAGLGVPLIAVRSRGAREDKHAVRIPPRANIASTAFLRLEGGLADLGQGATAMLELHAAFDGTTTMLGDRVVPLEADLTAPLAYQLGSSIAWSLEIRAFFSGDEWQDQTGMWMLQPYQKGKIPVVFVHGTASSPARWAEMFNQLYAEGELRSTYQFWFFTYTTGNPVAYSASLLRDALTEIVQELDPEGADPSLRNMVVIGHSQGGLLAKMQAIHSGEAFWKNAESATSSVDGLSEEDRKLLRHILVFDPHPAVKRLVFIATPQRGSTVADNWLVRIFDGFVSLPSKLRVKSRTAYASPDLMKLMRDAAPTAVENMSPEHPFVRALASIDVAEGIPCHSIISVKGDGDPEPLDDGFVSYRSAHLAYTESEFVVRSGHSCQGNPRTVQEVRRILLEHLRKSAKPAI